MEAIHKMVEEINKIVEAALNEVMDSLNKMV